MFAQLAVSWKQRVVDAVFNRRHAPKIGKDGLEVIVGQVLEFAEGHDGVELARADISGSEYGNEHRLAVMLALTASPHGPAKRSPPA